MLRSILILAILLFACPAQADRQPIPMPKELLGWWDDLNAPNLGLEIRPSTILDQKREALKTKDVCWSLFKVIRHLPEKRETYLVSMRYCDDGARSLSYERISSAHIKNVQGKPYEYIYLDDSFCSPSPEELNHFDFDADKLWRNIMLGNPKCPKGAFSEQNIAASWLYKRH